MFVHEYNFSFEGLSSDLIEEYDLFVNELHERAMKDPHSLDCAAQMAKRVPDYQKVCEILTPELEKQLDLYIAACEEYEHAFVFLAYMMGRDHQRRGIPPARLLFSDIKP